MKNRVDILESELYSHTSKDTYGTGYEDHLVEQYRTYVEMADRISERRANANSFFLTVITVLVSVMAIVHGFGTQTEDILGSWLIIVSIIGVILCYGWYRILESYRQLNSGKFKVIHIIEKRLPIAAFRCEWLALGEGKRPDIYHPLTNVEKRVPVVFAILFIALIVVGIFYILK
ncbi:hypothetical protein KAR91_10390 [Candidatus Pacearchaeota archaeon]|nr:hypothetical protein [Candidatus Pacearchaeota archaeon]